MDVRAVSLRVKLTGLGIIFSILPVLIYAGVNAYNNNKLQKSMSAGFTELVDSDLSHIVKSIYNMNITQQELLQQSVDHSLNVAREVLNNSGDVVLSEDEKVEWAAINQFSKQKNTVKLPKMFVGDDWLGKNSDPGKFTPVVDKVKALVGGTCTIFQRMNENGDMLRVATNVEKLDNSRAIGTYIPASNSDGTPNKVVKTLLSGKTFHGRAFVVNAWYLTAYEPIYGKNKKIIGALYFGVKQESGKELRKVINDIKLGKTGYVYVLDSKGHYVISKDGKRDGELIWDAKDNNGNLFVQEMIRKAHASKPGELFKQSYPWQNPGEEKARIKIATLIYYQPWDWIIGAGAYEDEIRATEGKVLEIFRNVFFILLGIIIVTLLISVAVWVKYTTVLSKKMEHISTHILNGSEEVSAASNQASSSGRMLADGAASQASSLEETSSSLEEMSSMTKQNADHAIEANSLMKESNSTINNVTDTMNELSASMEEISEASEETSKIIKTIDEIAFQTNLLALNAAVEAARAGEAGAGFAVVADEVRNLAMRAAEAAKNTEELIAGTVTKISHGTELTARTGEGFFVVSKSVSKVGELVGEIAAASKEQSGGIDQINKAISEIDSVVQQVASNAEESAAASSQMQSQAEDMKGMAGELVKLVTGKEVGDRVVENAEMVAGQSQAQPDERNLEPGLCKKEKISPSQVIPMEDNDFEEF